jgi:hypothetical protein
VATATGVTRSTSGFIVPTLVFGLPTLWHTAIYAGELHSAIIIRRMMVRTPKIEKIGVNGNGIGRNLFCARNPSGGDELFHP